MASDLSDDKKITAAIKEKPPAEAVKLVGLYRLYQLVNAAEKKSEEGQCLSAYQGHLAEKALFESALEVYRCQKGFSANSTPNLAEFFTPEEMASPTFAEAEMGQAPAGLFLRILESNDQLSHLIQDHDKEVLRHLEHVEVFKHADKDDFAVEFVFAKNDFFAQEKVRLEVTVDEEGDEMERVAKVVCSPKIEWLPGKDPRHKEKKVPAKGKKKAKVTLSKQESFFWIFQDIERPDRDEEEDEEEEDNEDDMFSPRSMYFLASEALEALERDLYQFTVPAMFGIKQPCVHDDDDDDAKDHKPKGNKPGDAKPECKQQ